VHGVNFFRGVHQIGVGAALIGISILSIPVKPQSTPAEVAVGVGLIIDGAYESMVSSVGFMVSCFSEEEDTSADTFLPYRHFMGLLTVVGVKLNAALLEDRVLTDKQDEHLHTAAEVLNQMQDETVSLGDVPVGQLDMVIDKLDMIPDEDKAELLRQAHHLFINEEDENSEA
jgi:hypothetical protein